MRFDEAPVSRALADLGYKRLKRYVYRASWSTEDVEHFLYLSTWGTPKSFLAAYFGLRNPRAEEFGLQSIRAYGGDLYRLLRHDARFDCCMKFSLGMLAGWGSRDSIYLPDTTRSEIVETVSASVRGRLFPVVENVTTVDGLLSLLLSDPEPCRWFRTNGAIRAAQIVSLARQVGMPSECIRVALRPYMREIGAQLNLGTNPDLYVETILGDYGDGVDGNYGDSSRLRTY